jgi:putative two-component system response regulator
MVIQSKDDSRETLLVVEDDLPMLKALRDILEGAGYQVRTATHGQEALELVKDEPPELIISDISMPVMDGFELFEAVRRQPGGAAIPFIFLTALGTREDRFAGRSLGADDYITKPVTTKELISAVQARLRRADEFMVEQLKAAIKYSLFALANAIELRDKYTREHVVRINAYAKAMARELGWDDERIESLEYGAILHDIGKIEVGSSILSKNGPLTPEEWEKMKRHPEDGAQMIGNVPHLSPAVPVILSHHERWDGTGYPGGLKGTEIPEEARLLSVVDSFDAMTTDRPYRAAISPELAYKEIIFQAGAQFDERMVEAFTRCWEGGEIHKIFNKNGNFGLDPSV